MRHTPLALMLSLVLAGTSTAQAGTVTVAYTGDVRQYADAGATPWDRDTNLKDLQNFLQALGPKYLPADRSVRIEVLDVDLAGDVRPVRLRSDERIVRGRADWPRITLRYTVSSGAQVLQSAEETVSDMGYLQHLTGLKAYDSLPYEKRMLEAWFKQRFVSSGD